MLQLVEIKEGNPIPQPLGVNDIVPTIIDSFDVLERTRSLLAQVQMPEKRFLLFTAHHLNTEHNEIYELDECVLEKIELIPFRIDSAGRGSAVAIATCLLEVLKLEPDMVLDLSILDADDTAWVIVHFDSPIIDATIEGTFKDLSEKLSHIKSELEKKIRAEIPLCKKAHVDNSWKRDDLLPVPGSRFLDRDGRASEVRCVQVGKAKVPSLNFFLAQEPDDAPKEVLKAFPTPDSESVQAECLFLKDIRKREILSTAEKEASFSILSRLFGDANLERGYDLCHEYAEGWDGYNRLETANLIARQASFGPRTCKNINKICGDKSKCQECPYWGKIKSPISIRGKDFILTRDTGFHFIDMIDGKAHRRPDYEGLRRYLHQKTSYVVMKDNQQCYRWDGKKWGVMHDSEIQAFAQTHFDPKPKSSVVSEFVSLVLRTELRDREWLSDSTAGRMNFDNGVLEISTMKFEPHSKEYGFQTLLPYCYDPNALCPRFDQFMEEITCNRQELIDVLKEFMGYSLSGDPYWEQKCMVLVGEGQNGKSKLIEVLQALAGEDSDNYSMMSFADLKKSENKSALDGALFNVSEETPSHSIMDSSDFKMLIGGAKITVKKLYKDPYKISNRAKFWMLCNTLPRSTDKTWALLRRLSIVPFDRIFKGEEQDRHIMTKLKAELPGILNSVIAAYKRMVERGHQRKSAIMEQQIAAYRRHNDNVLRFWVECVVDRGDGSEVFEFIDDLYLAYREYVEKEQNEKPTPKSSFFQRLSQLFPAYEARTQLRNKGKRQTPKRVLMGVMLKEEAAEEYASHILREKRFSSY